MNDAIYAKCPKEANPLSQMQAGGYRRLGEGKMGSDC